MGYQRSPRARGWVSPAGSGLFGELEARSLSTCASSASCTPLTNTSYAARGTRMTLGDSRMLASRPACIQFSTVCVRTRHSAAISSGVNRSRCVRDLLGIFGLFVFLDLIHTPSGNRPALPAGRLPETPLLWRNCLIGQACSSAMSVSSWARMAERSESVGAPCGLHKSVVAAWTAERRAKSPSLKPWRSR